MARIPLAWMQLKKEKGRFAVALAGVGFAVVLILMQMGFRESMFESAVQFHRAMRYDLVLIDPKTDYIVVPSSFSRRRLYQALGVPSVESVTAVYMWRAQLRNPDNGSSRLINVVGIDPADGVFDLPEVRAGLREIRKQDVLLFDQGSRPEFGPIADYIDSGRRVRTELNDREVELTALFKIGTSFGIDGSVITSDANFLRIFPRRERGLIDYGLIRLESGTDASAAAEAVRSRLDPDVAVLTRQQFIEREQTYWRNTTPIGAVFTLGVVIGILVGAIIVYQILFADVSDHMVEYATLKAMGYSNGYLSRVVLEESLILAGLGFIPGLAISWWLYGIAGNATRLPMIMTPERVGGVLLLTVAMCTVSALIALRKVRAADPADIF
jgi:putative ABC transport system permease protein